MIKKIWITGASSGIGEALAKKFAKEGWQVAVSARRENLLQNLTKHNSNIYPFTLATALIFHTDFTNQMQLISFLKNFAIAGGFLILFINGAGKYSLDYKLS